MFSYPTEFLAAFISHTLLLTQRLLLFSTLVTLLSITLYLNGPNTKSVPHSASSTAGQIQEQNLEEQTTSASKNGDFCLAATDADTPTISGWNWGGPTLAEASKCTAKKYRVIKVKIPYKLDEKIKLKKKKRKIKVHGKISIPIKVPKKIYCGKKHNG